MNLAYYEMLKLLPRAQELLRFTCSRLVHNYKPVLVRIFLSQLPALSFPFAEVARQFMAFYRDARPAAYRVSANTPRSSPMAA
ncbi:MAG: hypothetical protein ACUVX8_04445 [Candidatus Zipacnadales bacterium]